MVTKSLCTVDVHFSSSDVLMVLLIRVEVHVFHSSLRFANAVRFVCWLYVAMATGQAWACRRALFHLALHCAWCLVHFSKELLVY